MDKKEYRPQVVEKGIETSARELLAVLQKSHKSLHPIEIVMIAEGKYNKKLTGSHYEIVAEFIEYLTDVIDKEDQTLASTDSSKMLNRFDNVEFNKSKAISDDINTTDTPPNEMNRFAGSFGETTVRRVTQLLTTNDFALELIQDMPHELKTKITMEEQDALQIVEALLKERANHLTALRNK